MRVAGVDPAAVDETSIGFRLAPRINAAGRLCRPEAALELLLTEDPAEATRLAEELERLNRERQGVEERILRERGQGDRVVARGAAPAEGLRRRRRRLARGRHRHRRLAARRALQPAGRPDRRHRRRLEGLGPVGRRRSTCTRASAPARSTSSASAATGPRRACRSSPSSSTRSRAAFGAYADSLLADEDLVPSTRVDAVVPGQKLTLGLCAELGAAGAVRAREPRRAAARRRLRARRSLARSATASTCASASASGPRLRARRSRSAWRRSSTASAASERYDVVVPAAGEPLERRRLAAARRPADLRRDRALRRAARLARRRSGGAGEAAWTPEARAVFAELELGRRARSGACSSRETFRALLDEAPVLAQAA